MTNEEFRKYGGEILTWIAEYFTNPERYRVLANVKPGEVRKRFPQSPPLEPESMDVVMKDFHSIIMPGLTQWNHPGFMAYFANSSSQPAILAELLAAAVNPNAMLWKTAPAAVELEEVVIDWIRQMIGLQEGFVGLMHDTASTSSLVALAAAREACGLNIREKGMTGRSDIPRLRLYMSEHAHSSIDKAALVLGLGEEGIRKIPANAEFQMKSEALVRAIEEDTQSGWKPCAVVATVGTTSTTSVDPVRDIAEIARRHGLWLHVDAAYAGNAAVLPEMRWLMDGCDAADSLVLNPHKWLFVPLDCSILLYRNPDAFRRAFSFVPEYLRSEEERNPMDYGIALGRRFRALKLWMVLRIYGVRLIREQLRSHIELAQKFRKWVEASENFEALAPSPFSVVCFRYNPFTKRGSSHQNSEELNRMNELLVERVNAGGEVFLSSTKVSGMVMIRLAVGNVFTKEVHVRKAWDLLRTHAAEQAFSIQPQTA